MSSSNSMTAVFAINSDEPDEDDATFRLLREMRDMKFRRTTQNLAYHFMIVFAALGVLAFVFSLTSLSVILKHRRKTLRQVFYILVVNFAIIDLLRGTCLILFSVRILKPEGSSRSARIALMKIDQVALVALRFCSLVTILNLVLITANEFLFIQFPLHYNKMVTRYRVLICVVISWLLSLVFVIGTMYVRNVSAKVQTVYVPRSRNSSVESNITRLSHRIRQKTGSEVQVQHIINFTLLAFCLVCLVIVLYCYTVFVVIVRRYQKQEQRNTVSLSDQRHSVGEDERQTSQAVRRYKFAVVIGSIIAIYMLYIVPYGVIQVLASVRVRYRQSPVENLVTRLSMQLLVGIHAVLQPLCYYRMRELRVLLHKTLCGAYQCGRRRDSFSKRTTGAAETSNGPMVRRAVGAGVPLQSNGKTSVLPRLHSISSNATDDQNMLCAVQSHKLEHQSSAPTIHTINVEPPETVHFPCLEKLLLEEGTVV